MAKTSFKTVLPLNSYANINSAYSVIISMEHLKCYLNAFGALKWVLLNAHMTWATFCAQIVCILDSFSSILYPNHFQFSFPCTFILRWHIQTPTRDSNNTKEIVKHTHTPISARAHSEIEIWVIRSICAKRSVEKFCADDSVASGVTGRPKSRKMKSSTAPSAHAPYDRRTIRKTIRAWLLKCYSGFSFVFIAAQLRAKVMQGQWISASPNYIWYETIQSDRIAGIDPDWMRRGSLGSEAYWLGPVSR